MFINSIPVYCYQIKTARERDNFFGHRCADETQIKKPKSKKLPQAREELFSLG
jgi:hypothetical protein